MRSKNRFGRPGPVSRRIGPGESAAIECVSPARPEGGLAPFHEDGPCERPEAFAIEGEPKLTHLENVEERLQLGAEFLLAYDRWAIVHRLFCVPCEAQPARALPRHAFEHPQECGEIPRANAVIDPSVEHDIVRPAEVDPRRITDTKVDFDPCLLRFLPRAVYRHIDEVDRGHPISATCKCDCVRAGPTSNLEDRFPGQQSGVKDTDQFRARDPGVPWRLAGRV